MGASSVFGANLTIKVPIYTVADDDENKPTRDTMGFYIFNNGLITAAKPDVEVGGSETLTPEKPVNAPHTGGAGHVKYLVEIEHGGDKWQTWKR